MAFLLTFKKANSSISDRNEGFAYMRTNRSLFDSLNAFIRKRHRVIVLVWVIALVVTIPLVFNFFSSISFNVTNSSSLSVPNSESEIAQAIINTQFPMLNASNSPIIVVFQNQNVYTDAVKTAVFSLNKTLGSDPKLGNFTGITSIYSEEESLLDSTVPIYLEQVAQIAGQLPNPDNGTAAWAAAAGIFVNTTSSIFTSSPLFTVDAPSLYNFLLTLNPTSTTSQVQTSVANLLSTEELTNYPYTLLPSITKNFVSSDNRTMIVELGFSTSPGSNVVTQARGQIK